MDTTLYSQYYTAYSLVIVQCSCCVTFLVTHASQDPSHTVNVLPVQSVNAQYCISMMTECGDDEV